MRHWQIAIAGVAILVLSACQKEPEPSAQVQQPYQPLTQMDTAPPEQSYATDPYASDPLIDRQTRTADREPTIATAPETETTLIAGEDATGVRTHTVQKGDTLYKLARTYYTDQSKWRDIWKANRGRLSDANKLEVGQTLVIP